jgi:hypothetical protein
LYDDKILPIIGIAYHLALQIKQVIVKFARDERPALGRTTEEAAFDMRSAPIATKFADYRVIDDHLLPRRENSHYHASRESQGGVIADV